MAGLLVRMDHVEQKKKGVYLNMHREHIRIMSDKLFLPTIWSLY